MCGLFLTVKFSCLFTAVAVLACLRSLKSRIASIIETIQSGLCVVPGTKTYTRLYIYIYLHAYERSYIALHCRWAQRHLWHVQDMSAATAQSKID